MSSKSKKPKSTGAIIAIVVVLLVVVGGAAFAASGGMRLLSLNGSQSESSQDEQSQQGSSFQNSSESFESSAEDSEESTEDSEESKDNVEVTSTSDDSSEDATVEQASEKRSVTTQVSDNVSEKTGSNASPNGKSSNSGSKASGSKSSGSSSSKTNHSSKPSAPTTTYAITYDLGGGEAQEALPATYTNKNGDLVLPTATRQYYQFLGWDDGTGNIQRTAVIEAGTQGNKTYKAVWKGSDYVVSRPSDRTPEMLRAYFETHPFDTDIPDTLDREPDIAAGDPGAYSQASYDNARNAVNFMRYMAGLDQEYAQEGEEKIRNAQAGAVVGSRLGNNGHSLKTNDGTVPTELYQWGSSGVENCDLTGSDKFGNGFQSCAGAVTGSFMPDNGNDGTALAHRWHCLNPEKKYISFGNYYDETTGRGLRLMWGNGGAGWKQRQIDYIAWPGVYTACEYYTVEQSYSWNPWCIYLTTGNLKVPDASKLKVTLTCNGKTTTIDTSNGAVKYATWVGSARTVIFRPPVPYKVGDKVDVRIEGLVASKDDLACPLEYSVNFFNLNMDSSNKVQATSVSPLNDGMSVDMSAGLSVGEESTVANMVEADVRVDGAQTDAAIDAAQAGVKAQAQAKVEVSAEAKVEAGFKVEGTAASSDGSDVEAALSEVPATGEEATVEASGDKAVPAATPAQTATPAQKTSGEAGQPLVVQAVKVSSCETAGLSEKTEPVKDVEANPAKSIESSPAKGIEVTEPAPADKGDAL